MPGAGSPPRLTPSRHLGKVAPSMRKISTATAVLGAVAALLTTAGATTAAVAVRRPREPVRPPHVHEERRRRHHPTHHRASTTRGPPTARSSRSFATATASRIPPSTCGSRRTGASRSPCPSRSGTTASVRVRVPEMGRQDLRLSTTVAALASCYGRDRRAQGVTRRSVVPRRRTRSLRSCSTTGPPATTRSPTRSSRPTAPRRHRSPSGLRRRPATTSPCLPRGRPTSPSPPRTGACSRSTSPPPASVSAVSRTAGRPGVARRRRQALGLSSGRRATARAGSRRRVALVLGDVPQRRRSPPGRGRRGRPARC